MYFIMLTGQIQSSGADIAQQWQISAIAHLYSQIGQKALFAKRRIAYSSAIGKH
jgi:hypothetical protein